MVDLENFILRGSKHFIVTFFSPKHLYCNHPNQKGRAYGPKRHRDNILPMKATNLNLQNLNLQNGFNHTLSDFSFVHEFLVRTWSSLEPSIDIFAGGAANESDLNRCSKEV